MAVWTPDNLASGEELVTPCCWTFRPLVYDFSDAADEKIRRYVYKGNDRSLLYTYVLSPVASWLVQWIPRWVAPNLITLAALLCPLSAALIFLQQCESFNCTDAPRWPFMYCSVAILLYQTLDNMDGKQARRTHSSSPLGLFVDHGCDAMTSVLSGISAGSMLVGEHMDTTAFVGLLTMCFTCFFFGAWEHYLQGCFELPVFSGPNEGLLMAASLGVLTWSFGVEWWSLPTSWGIAPIGFVWIGSYTGQVYTVATHLLSTTRWLHTKPNGARMSKLATLSVAPLIYILALGTLWSYVDPLFVRTHPHVVLLLCGCVHVESCNSFMYCHMSQSAYSIAHFSMIPLGLAAANGVLGWGFGVNFVYALLFLSSTYVIGCYAHAVLRIAGALGISVMRIPASVEGQSKDS